MTVEVLALPLYEIDGWTGNATDEHGVDWIITAEEGWSSPPDARADFGERPSEDGVDDAPTYEAARIITLSGVAIAYDWAAQNAAKDRLNAVAYTSRDLYPLTVTENHLTRLAYVRRAGAQKVADRPGFAFDFALSLTAPDPRRYAADLTTLSATMPGYLAEVGREYPRTYPMTYPASVGYQPVLNANNVGTRDTGATITIVSGLDQPGVINVATGEYLQFNLSLGTTDVIEIDLSDRTAVLNGTASRRGALMTGSSWFRLTPGDNNLRLMGTPNGTGAPVMTISYRSAWK